MSRASRIARNTRSNTPFFEIQTPHQDAQSAIDYAKIVFEFINGRFPPAHAGKYDVENFLPLDTSKTFLYTIVN
jgi:hypothetical protein